MLRRLVAAAAALAALSGTATGQAAGVDGARQPTFLRVEGADGAPLAGAVVTFVGCLPHVGVLGPLDESQVQADARGRVHARLDPSLCYVAWAVGPEGAGGARAGSRPLGWFAAGGVMTLRCDQPAPPRRVRVDGAGAWVHRGPLRYLARTYAPGSVVELALDDGGELTVPPGPFVQLEVRTADGAPLWVGSLSTVSRHALTIPPPQRVPVRVTDERGAPLPGARLELRVGRPTPWRVDGLAAGIDELRRPLGATGADGTCEIEVPYAADPRREASAGELVLFASAPGRSEAWGGALNGAMHTRGEPRKGAFDGPLEFVCPPCDPLPGSVGRVPAGTAVHVAVVVKLQVGASSYQHDPRSLVAPVAPDGTFVLADVPADVVSMRCTLVPAAAVSSPWPVLAASLGRELPRELARATGAAGGGSVLVMDGFGDVAVQVVEPNGGPARGRVVLLTAVTAGRVLTRDATVRVPLDARGAAALRLAPGRWVLTICNENGWAAREAVVAAGTQQLAIAMQPPAFARFELRGADGEPVAGARVSSRGSTMRGTTDPVQSVLQGLRTQWTETWTALRTDAAGRVAVPFVPIDGVSTRIALQWPGGATADLVVEPMDDWLPVRPR